MSVQMKAPANCSGASVWGCGYEVDEQGNIEADEFHVSELLSHGFTITDHSAELEAAAAAHAAQEAADTAAVAGSAAVVVAPAGADDVVPAADETTDTPDAPAPTVADVLNAPGKKNATRHAR